MMVHSSTVLAVSRYAKGPIALAKDLWKTRVMATTFYRSRLVKLAMEIGVTPIVG